MPEETLPASVVERAIELTKRAIRANEPPESDRYRARRDAILDRYDVVARVRERGDDPVLVVYPATWRDGETVAIDRIEDPGRAVERPLWGPNEDEAWEDVEAANRAVVAMIRDRHGPIHGANAAALADYMGNHHHTRIEDASRDDLERFREDYYVRNAWPSDEEAAAVDETLSLITRVFAADSPDL